MNPQTNSNPTGADRTETTVSSGYPDLNHSGDLIVSALAYHGQVRAFACRTIDLCREAQRLHGLSPMAAVALGRLMSGILLMAEQGLKNDQDSITAIVHGDAVHVPPDADETVIETLRVRLSSELDRVNKRAYELCGKHDASRSNPAAHG